MRPAPGLTAPDRGRVLHAARRITTDFTELL